LSDDPQLQKVAKNNNDVEAVTPQVVWLADVGGRCLAGLRQDSVIGFSGAKKRGGEFLIGASDCFCKRGHANRATRATCATCAICPNNPTRSTGQRDHSARAKAIAADFASGDGYCRSDGER
jgi:hypothetical protein